MRRGPSRRLGRQSLYAPIWFLALASALPFAACGGDEDGGQAAPGAKAGSAGVDAGRGGAGDDAAGAGGGTSDTSGGNAGESGGNAGESNPGSDCEPRCEAPSFCEKGECVECSAASLPRCAGQQTPEACVNGTWVSGTSCAESSQVCSNGVCVGRYLFGALTSVNGPSGGTGIKLVGHGFEAGAPISCGSDSCLSGGIRP